MEDQTGQFSVVVHELKNPLLAIERLSSMVLEKEGLSEGAKRKLELIQSSAKEAFGYLEEVDTSAAPALPDEFSCEPVDVGVLARRVIESFQMHAEYKDQELRCVAPSEQCVVLGDEDRLREAMNNLVSNALKYSPRGETVKVWVERTDEAVYFSVSDNGPGLSDSEQDRLFEPFQRLGPEPTADEDATGLGLYVVNEVVDRHGGEVEVDTVEGDGSTFTIVLPAASSSGDGHADSTAVPDIAPGVRTPVLEPAQAA